MCQRSDGRGRTGAGDGLGRPRSRPRTAAPNRTAACPTAVGLARRAPGTRGGIRSDEAVGAPRAVQQIRARAALDAPVADLGEALRVRQGIEQPRQPLGRLGVELPGRQTAEQRPLFGAPALQTLFPAFPEPLFGPFLRPLRQHRSSPFQIPDPRQGGPGEPPPRQHPTNPLHERSPQLVLPRTAQPNCRHSARKPQGKRPAFRAPKPRAGRSVRPPRRPPSTHGATDPMPGRSVWSGLGACGCACGNPARRPGRAWWSSSVAAASWP